MTSCQKDLYDAEEAERNKKVSDLIVPENFNWEMSRKVTINLKSAIETKVSLFLSKECTAETQIAEYTISSVADLMPIELDLPASIDRIYAKEIGKTPEELTIQNNSIEYTLPTTRVAKPNTVEQSDIFYSTWYTVLLEDQFPLLGDYDFNDFVANYRYRTYYNISPNGKKIKLSKIEVDLRINAIGGCLPYHPFLRINGLNSANNNTTIIGKDGSGNQTNMRIYYYDRGNKAMTIDISRFSLKPEWNKYINTVKDEKMMAPTTASITIDFNNQGENTNSGGIDVEQKGRLNIEIFLMKKDMEIHKKGMLPLNVGQYPHHEIQNGEGKTYYCNNKNLVWVIEVPELISHAIEKENFSRAYPRFNEWVTSGGEKAKDWYHEKNKDKVIDLSNFWSK